MWCVRLCAALRLAGSSVEVERGSNDDLERTGRSDEQCGSVGQGRVEQWVKKTGPLLQDRTFAAASLLACDRLLTPLVPTAFGRMCAMS